MVKEIIQNEYGDIYYYNKTLFENIDFKICIYSMKNWRNEIVEVNKNLDYLDLIVIFNGNPYKPDFIFSISERATIENINDFKHIEKEEE